MLIGGDRDRTGKLIQIEGRAPSRYRWITCMLVCLMALVLFMDRTSISVAAPEMMKEFDLNKTQMGFVFSIFVFSYALGNIPGGWLGDRFGPRITLTILVAFWSIMTAATAHATGLISLLIIRFVFGLGEAGAWPMATRSVQYWFPKSERGFVSGATHSSALFATSAVPVVAIAIMEAFGWRSIFHIFGLFGLVWAAVWYFWYRDRPANHPRVNEAELAYIQQDREPISAETLPASRSIVPWGSICKSPDVWFLGLSYIAFNYVNSFFYFWMPTFLLEYHHISMRDVGFLASLPLGAGAVGSLLGGIFTDLVFKKTGDLKLSRRLACVIAMLGSSVFLLPAALASSPQANVLFLSISIFLLALSVAPTWATAMDISGGYSGSVSGIMNMVGQAGGVLSPIIFGALSQNGYWLTPLFITAAVLIPCAALWAFYIDPERSIVSCPTS